MDTGGGKRGSSCPRGQSTKSWAPQHRRLRGPLENSSLTKYTVCPERNRGRAQCQCRNFFLLFFYLYGGKLGITKPLQPSANVSKSVLLRAQRHGMSPKPAPSTTLDRCDLRERCSSPCRFRYSTIKRDVKAVRDEPGGVGLTPLAEGVPRDRSSTVRILVSCALLPWGLILRSLSVRNHRHTIADR